MAYINPIPSVVAFQQNPSSLMVGASVIGLTPVAVTNTPNVNATGSVVAFQGGAPWPVAPNNSSVIAFQLAGSVLATSATVNAGNSSVMLLNSANTIGSVTALQGTNPWITNTGGSVAAVIIGGSVATATTNSSVMLLNSANVIGSVATLQGTVPWVVKSQDSSVIAYQAAGSVLAVSATINTGNSSVTLLNGSNVIGSVTALQGTNPWITNIGGSVAAVIIGGSVATATTNSSVTLLNGSNVIGSVTALQGTNPWLQTFSNSSIIATQLAGSILATSATVTMSNSSVMLLNGANVIGSVTALQGTNPWNISSIYGNISGSVVSTQGTSPWVISSIYGNISGSVVSTQGTTPWTISSVYGNISGSVVSFQGGAWVNSVLSEVTRNDTLASTLGADLTPRPQMGDAIGRTVIKPFVSEDSTIISYTGSVVSASVTLIQASALGKKSYITDFWAANTGSVAQLLTFQDGSTSILGYTILPAGGGSNSQGINVPLKTANAQDLAYKVTGTSSVIYLTVKGWQGQ